MGAVLISPEAGTYTFRYRQSSDWLLGRASFLRYDDGDDNVDSDGDGDGVQVQVVLRLVAENRLLAAH